MTYNIVNWEFEDEPTIKDGRIIYKLKSVSVSDLVYDDGRKVKNASFSFDEFDQIVFKDDATGNVVGIPRSCLGSTTVANTWYTGAVDLLSVDQYAQSHKIYASVPISHTRASVIIVNDPNKPSLSGVNLNTWDAKIAANDELTNWISKNFKIEITAKNPLGTSFGDAESMRAFANSDSNGICCIMGASYKATAGTFKAYSLGFLNGSSNL